MILPRQKRKEQENAKEKRRKVKGVNIKRLKGQQKRQQKGAVGNKKRNLYLPEVLHHAEPEIELRSKHHEVTVFFP